MLGLKSVQLLYFCIYLTKADDFSRCPPALKPIKYLRTFRNKCYEFATYREDYWSDAQGQCHRKGGQLAMVPDKETQHFFIQALQTLGFSKTGLWIGLNDRHKENHYEWVNGETAHFTYWASGEPNLILHGIYDCVLMKRNVGYHWVDHPCHLWPQHYSYICEYDMLPTTTTTTTTTSAATSTPTTTVSPTTKTTSTSHPTSTTTVTSATTTMATLLVTSGQTTLLANSVSCPAWNCDTDCGLTGFKTDPTSGCSLCECLGL